MSDMTTPLGEAFRRLAEDAPDAPALTCAEVRLTRAELDEAADRLAAAFAARGARPDTFVTIGLPNSTDFLVAALAAWKIGATPQPVSARLPDRELSAILDLVEPSLVVGLESSRHPTMPVAVGIESAGPRAPRAARCWKAPVSGGSTGRPKVIVADAPAVLGSVAPFASLLGMQLDGVHLATGPLHHNGPFMMASIALLTGNHVVVMPKFDPVAALAAVARHQVDWMYAVPTMLSRMLRLPEGERRVDLSSLRRIMHMAAPCPPWVKRAWIDWIGAERVWELYAGTEAQAVTLISGTEWLAHPGSVGRPAIGEIKVLDAENAPCSAGIDGWVWLRRGAGAASPYHYLGSEARRTTDGWECLGDVGHLDADGYLYLGDRDTDMILIGGSNVYPAEVEGVLDEHPDVISSCVIGLPDDDLGAVVHALVQPRVPLSADTLVEWCRERLDHYKVPRSIEFVDHPLRDDGGKVRRSALRAERFPSA